MIGRDIHNLASELWDINRSITGDGVRKTLEIISNHIPNLIIRSVPSGEKVFDWTIPKEWKVNDAFIIDPKGKKICDFKKNNLHLVGYSSPANETLPLKELQQYLYSLPDQPTAVPYITSYYKQRWGFCISQKERDNLIEGNYKILIDSELFDGVLNYGELILKGQTEKEVLLSSYICHPSMANNELSGPTVLTFLTKWLTQLPSRKYTYRIVLIPETIGSITYLSKNYEVMKKRTLAGFNISCVGDNRTYSFLPSRNGDTLSDSVAKHVLRWIYPDYKKYKWTDRGSDERQYCSPGIDLPIASIMRTKYAEYPEYHTSLDNLIDVVTPEGLQGGFIAIQKAIETLEKNIVPEIKVLCEPQLGKRGLYPNLSTKDTSNQTKIISDLITYSDGKHSLLEIANLMDVPIWELYDTLETLINNNLIQII